MQETELLLSNFLGNLWDFPMGMLVAFPGVDFGKGKKKIPFKTEPFLSNFTGKLWDVAAGTLGLCIAFPGVDFAPKFPF